MLIWQCKKGCLLKLNKVIKTLFSICTATKVKYEQLVLFLTEFVKEEFMTENACKVSKLTDASVLDWWKKCCEVRVFKKYLVSGVLDRGVTKYESLTSIEAIDFF